MPMVKFDTLPDDARVWVFGSGAPVDEVTDIHERRLEAPTLRVGRDPLLEAPRHLVVPVHVTHHRVQFLHPTSGETMDFTSRWPADLTPWLVALRTKEETK